jgi:hypothetical protein
MQVSKWVGLVGKTFLHAVGVLCAPHATPNTQLGQVKCFVHHGPLICRNFSCTKPDPRFGNECPCSNPGLGSQPWAHRVATISPFAYASPRHVYLWPNCREARNCPPLPPTSHHPWPHFSEPIFAKHACLLMVTRLAS